MAGESLGIVELSGSRRSVVLRGRAMPHRPVAWPREIVLKEQRYSGNPVKTIQVLGPDHRPLELRGTWKTKFVSDDASLWGFDDLWSEGDAITAELLVAVFDRLLAAGNLLEVSWGPEVWRGVMRAFEPNYQRVEDIEWSATFAWTQRGEMTAPLASPFTDSQSENNDALSALEDAMAAVPPFAILPAMLNPLEAGLIVAREAMLSLASGLAAISGVPEVGADQFQAVASAAEAAATACRDMAGLALDSSIESFIATDDVASALAAQTWSQSVGAAANEMGAAAINTREAVRSRVVDGYLAVVVLRQGQTLRSLALQYYGSADAWVTIAEANGLSTSNPPAGLIILVPRRARAGA